MAVHKNIPNYLAVMFTTSNDAGCRSDFDQSWRTRERGNM